MAAQTNGITNGKNHSDLVVFVKKYTPTSTQNAMKPLMLLHELNIPYTTRVLQSPENEPWFAAVNPYQQVPALEHSAKDNPSETFMIFESSACLLYIASQYDKHGVFSGTTESEKAKVLSWLCAYTAGLGPAGKIWHLLELKAKREETQQLDPALDYLRGLILDHYVKLDKQLAGEGQIFVALPDRPTLADYAIIPFANEKIAATANISFDDMPRLRDWSRRMLEREAVIKAGEVCQTFA